MRLLVRARTVLALALFCITCELAFGQEPEPCSVDTIAGGGAPVGYGGLAIEAELAFPWEARIGPDGLLYIADPGHHAIRRVESNGSIRTFAGSGRRELTGDGGPADQAGLPAPRSLAFALDGSLYFSDGPTVRRIDSSGVVTRIAGNGRTGDRGDGGPAVEASLGSSLRIALGPAGEVYIASSDRHTVRVVGPDGVIRLLAGTAGRGRYDGDGGPAKEASIAGPTDVAIDSEGNVYIPTGARRVRIVTPDGRIDTYLGGADAPGRAPQDGLSRHEIGFGNRISNIEIDSADTLYWLDFLGVRALPKAGPLTTIAPAEDGELTGTFTLADDATPYLTRRHQALRVRSDGSTVLIAGVGDRASRGDGGPASRAILGSVGGIAAAPDGSVYIADQTFHRARVVRPDGTIHRFAGTGENLSGSSEGAALHLPMASPRSVAVAPDGDVYVVQFSFGTQAGRIWAIDADGQRRSIAGTTNQVCLSNPTAADFWPSCGNGGPATEAVLPDPSQMAVDSRGSIYLLQNNTRDFPARWVRVIAPDGTIDELPRQTPDAWAIAVGPDDSLALSSGSVSLIEGQAYSFDPDGNRSEVLGYQGFARRATAMVYDAEGDLYFAERGDFFLPFGAQWIKRLTPEGAIHLVAGSVVPGFAGDGGPARDARFDDIAGLAIDAEGNLLIADRGNGRVRRVNDVSACGRTELPQIALRGIVNGASFRGPLIAPGLIVSIFGVRLGPEDLALAVIDSGTFPSVAGGVRVLIDGLPAPMLFSSSGQVSAIVPFAIGPTAERTGPSARTFDDPITVELEYDGLLSDPTYVPVTASSPAIFTLDSSGSGQGAILNQDGTVNGLDNPAAPGSVIVIFATGSGVTDPPSIDGIVAARPLPVPVAAVRVLIDGVEAQILYAGAAPGLVAGVTQINALLPSNLSAGTVEIQVEMGGVPSPRVQASIGP